MLRHPLLSPLLTWLPITLVLTACRGGSSGSNATPAPPQPRTPQQVVLLADKDVDEQNELYVGLDDGSSLDKLSGAMVTGGSVTRYLLSPDASKIAYVADQQTDDVFELFVVGLDGSPPIKVSQNIAGNADVGHSFGARAMFWSPDSTRIAYLADTDIDTVDELFLVNTDGSDHHKINGPVGSTLEIGLAAWSTNGRYVAYFVRNRNAIGFRSDRIAINMHDTQVGGSNSTRVSPDLLSRWIDHMMWAPDGARLAYVADLTIASVRELYITNPTGVGANIQVNQPQPTRGIHFRFDWSANSRHLVYLAFLNGIWRLYSHDTIGAPQNRVELTRSMPLNATIADFLLSPDDARVAYLADQNSVGTIELHVASIDGASSQRLVSAQPGSDIVQMAWNPNGSGLAYVGDLIVDDQFQVYVIAPDGLSPPVQLSGSNDLENPRHLAWSPDGSRVFYQSDSGSATWAGAAKTTMSFVDLVEPGTFPASIPFGVSPWSDDGSRVLFLASSTNPGPQGAYVVEPGGARTMISGPLVVGGSVASATYVRITPAPRAAR